MTLDQFNKLTATKAFEYLFACCHCRRWAQDMQKARPFASVNEVLEYADDYWRTASESDILEAFSGHARIGDMELLRSRYAGRAKQEQGQILGADETSIRRLHELNVEYEKRYGFIFIVCATNKSAEQMLALIERRIYNGRDAELANGAREQGAITQLRLRQLLTETETQSL